MNDELRVGDVVRCFGVTRSGQSTSGVVLEIKDQIVRVRLLLTGTIVVKHVSDCLFLRRARSRESVLTHSRPERSSPSIVERPVALPTRLYQRSDGSWHVSTFQDRNNDA